MSASDGHVSGDNSREGGRADGKGVHGGGSGFGGYGCTVIGALQVNNVGRDVDKWEVVHAFIEAHMFSDFDNMSIDVIP